MGISFLIKLKSLHREKTPTYVFFLDFCRNKKDELYSRISAGRYFYSDMIEAAVRKQPSRGICKKVVLENFPKFTGKHLCHFLFFNKVACREETFLEACNFSKKRLWDWCFPVNFAKFLRNLFS